VYKCIFEKLNCQTYIYLRYVSMTN